MTHPDYSQPHELIRYFQYEHLPEHLQSISKRGLESAAIPKGCRTAPAVAELASQIDIATATNNPEKEMALRKLLEAKDCAVRASL